MLLIAALTARGYSTHNSLVLTKMNYRRLKEKERPRSEKEQRRMLINQTKTKVIQIVLLTLIPLVLYERKG